jgi:hypothetical protein
VQKWREIQIQEKEARLKKVMDLKENVQDCKDCERKVNKSQWNKRRQNEAHKLADWKQIKVMKEELLRTDNVVETVKMMQNSIKQRLFTVCGQFRTS